MKIEIGESLIRTWLRHVEGCQFAELNWKTSPTWPNNEASNIEAIFESIKTKSPKAISTKSLSQFLKQAEVDVLGQRVESDGLVKTHFVDIAYHSGGLNYGGTAKTKVRVQKKLIRSALLALEYFPKSDSTIYFITPFIGETMKSAVMQGFEQAIQFFKGYENLSFELILDEEFKTRVLDEVLALEGEVADTSELFLRSWQLVSPFIAVNSDTSKSHQFEAIDQQQSTDENNEKVLIVALYLSKFGHLQLDIGNQTETFKELGRILDVKPSTLRNYRDRFDRYVDNHRQGWDAELPQKYQQILDNYKNASESELRRILDLS